MHLVTTIIKIRLFQFFRLSKEIGILRFLIISPLIYVILLMAYKSIVLSEGPLIFLIVITLGILSSHIGRKDKHFFDIAGLNSFHICLIEYGLCTLPFILGYAISPKWAYALALTAIVVLVSSIKLSFILFFLRKLDTFSFLSKSRTVQKNKKLFSIIFPATSFEWITGLRVNWFSILLLYVLTVVFSAITAVIPAFLVILGLILSSFYMYAEPSAMLEIFELPSGKLIRMKVLKHLKYYFILVFPLLVIFIILNYDIWYILAYALLVSVSTQVFAILAKYAAYQPNESLQQNYVYIFLAVICFCVTFLSPVPIVMIIRNYFKSLSNLKKYLNAYN